MNDVAIVSIKQRSERVPGKNFIEINGQKLYKIFTTTLIQSECFDEIVVDTDSEEIKDWCHTKKITVVDREPRLAENSATGNMILRYNINKLENKYQRYWQGFVTSPFVSVNTVQSMVTRLRQAEGNDSIMTVKTHRDFFWNSRGFPVGNYRPDVNPRSQDIDPIYSEVCGLFGLTAAAFEITQTRYGISPIMFPLPAGEMLDIDWPEDIPENQRK